MGFIDRAYYFFTPYTDAHERAVATFFKGLTEHSNRSHTQARLRSLLQGDSAVINLWTEYRYKGYHYLQKTRRKQLYANLKLIAADFDHFYQHHAPSVEAAVARIQQQAPQVSIDADKAVCVQALMAYFAPQRGTYEYLESSSFGRLLRNPAHEKLVGDCNQIVTLYIYLYSRYYDVGDLQVRVLPEHVALHYSGIDIETTNGTYKDYSSIKNSKLLPIEEIVSINLLDTTDAYLATHEIAPEDFLQASRFAFILSHERELVARNLAAAYSNLVGTLMKRSDYKQALGFAKASGDVQLLNIVGRNGAVHEMERHNYAAARRFAGVAAERDELVRATWQSEAAEQYRAQHYREAIKAFEHIHDQEGIRRCYAALFFVEQAKLPSQLTTDVIKQHATIIKNMRMYAKKSGNNKLIEHAAVLGKHL